jgi:hypothetical protein
MSTMCGDGMYVSRSQLRKVPTPNATNTWKPIPHDFVVQQVEQTIAGHSLEVAKETYLLARGGQRMFGILDLRSPDDKDYGLSVGIRNSHDMSFPVALLLGARVFVCSNLSFSGEVKVQTKHTKFVMDRLPKLVCGASTQLLESRGAQDKRIAAYKATEIERKKEAAYIMLQAIRTDVIPTRLIDNLITEWEKPSHDEFAASWSAWRMFNAVTEVLKQASPLKIAERTQRLHGLMDAHCGLLNSKVLAV